MGEPLSYFLFEVMVLVLLAVCFVYSVRSKDLPPVSRGLELTVFILYGLAFESIAVAAGFYSYAPFTLSVGHAPLVIGVGWAVIGFSAMRFSDSLNMPQASKPFLDALLALLIDLGMDAVAIRDRYTFEGETFEGETLGMWNWGLALDEQWFGVPYANFMAWWLVVFVMSAALRSGRYLYGWFARAWLAWLYPVGALAVALSVFLFLLFTFTSAFNVTVLLLLVGLSVVVSVSSLQGRQRRLTWLEDAPVFLVPLAFHLFFFTLMLGRGLYVASPRILGVSVLAFVIHEGILLMAARGSSKTKRSPADLTPR